MSVSTKNIELMDQQLASIEHQNVDILDSISDRDYTGLMLEYTDKFQETEQYIYVGMPAIEQGWILHITIIPTQIRELSQILIPELIEADLPFKMIRDSHMHSRINSGSFGKYKIGKIFTIFLDDEAKLIPLLQNLIPKTDQFIGPSVFTDFPISNIIYTRYGTFIDHIEEDLLGNKVRLIKDGSGNLMYDKYYSPPIIPPGVENIFLSIIEDRLKGPRLHLLGNKFMPVKLLKSDAKGDVLKGLYFNKYYLPKWCVIKQARKGMYPDDHGRDMRDRLTWQRNIIERLQNSVDTPKVIDYLDTTKETYLILEYIHKGTDFAQLIFAKSKHLPWYTQSNKIKSEILHLDLQIIEAISKMHESGYLHRDITGTNFLVTRRHKVKLIDLELTYSLQNEEPNPPFGIGTKGFMSPAQEQFTPPCKEDDIYSIGALLIMSFFGGLDPLYIIDSDKITLEKKLFFFIREETISRLIAACLSQDPAERPQLSFIHSTLKKYKDSLHKKTSPTSEIHVTKAEIEHTINKAIEALSSGSMTHEDLFFSKISNEYGNEVYPLSDKHTFSSIYRGASGPIWLLCMLKRQGYDIGKASNNIEANLEFILSELTSKLDRLSPSYYYGTTGLVETLFNTSEIGLHPQTDLDAELLKSTFIRQSSSLNLLFGIAGQGIAALRASSYLESDFRASILENYARILLEQQDKNGSWKEPNSDEITHGFGYGMAGIIYFLLDYDQTCNNPDARIAAEKGLAYLTKQIKKIEKYYAWQVSNKNKSISSWWCNGSPGIALTYLKAYLLTQNPQYKIIAENSLRIHSRTPLFSNLSQCHGLAGLGEIYLEAYSITKNPEWQERAAWIAGTLINLRKETPEGYTYWLSDSSDFPTADFMVGNSGIVHFLARYLNPQKFGFPLLNSKI